LSEIKEVHSKDQALGQCRAWLRRNLPDAQLVDTSSTAHAVKLAKSSRVVAAVASGLAAELYELPVYTARDSGQDRQRHPFPGGW
jgi:chorismate mutase/prephenate dehydratase